MRRSRLFALVALLVLLLAACGGEEGNGGTADTDATTDAGGGDDLLSSIQDEGVIKVSTDPAYPPQSSLTDEGGYEGFDIDVAEEIASRLGVEVEWVTPSFDAITAGSWQGRWDMSVGSVTITPERQKVLHFTDPYRYDTAAAAVHTDNTTVSDLETDLDGATIGVCSACSYEFYLDGTLEIVGTEVEFIIDDAEIKTYDTDSSAIQDLALGDGVRLDSVISSLFTLKTAEEQGTPIKVVGDPLFSEPLGVAFDKESELDPTSLVEEVNSIIGEMHSDGTLTEISEKWYGIDLTKEA